MTDRTAIIVTGDRFATFNRWDQTIKHAFRGVETWCKPVLIHGNCRGIDRVAAGIAKDMGWTILPMDYIERLGKAGGPVRNKEMANVGCALQRVGYEVSCFAFHDDLENSKGTRNMVETAKKAGIEVIHYQTSGKAVIA